MKEDEVRKGLPVFLQDACELMTKDRRFRKVLSYFDTWPSYVLKVYLQEWRELEERNILLGAFRNDRFFRTDFENPDESAFLSKLYEDLSVIPMSKNEFLTISEKIVKGLSESFWDTDIKDLWREEDQVGAIQSNILSRSRKPRTLVHYGPEIACVSNSP